MATHAVLAATALLTTLSLTSAYDSNYGNSLYARSYTNDHLLNPSLSTRSLQKILARRAVLDESYETTILHARNEPCKPGCLCARHMAAREANAEADPVGEALFEHDDILFNYRRALDFDSDADFDIDARDADPEADPEADALFEHDDILFNYKREAEADGEGSFFDELEFFDLISRHLDSREAEADADAEADPVGEALFEHDDILFNYKRDAEAEAEAEGDSSFFDDLEFSDLISRRNLNTNAIDTREANANAEAEADPVGEALFEHDDILFNYKRSPLASTSGAISRRDTLLAAAAFRKRADGYTPWAQSATAQARKDEYKSPGQTKAEEAAKNNPGGSGSGSFAGDGNGFGGGGGAGGNGAGGVGGNAFNGALDAGSAGATSMDAGAMDAGGLSF